MKRPIDKAEGRGAARYSLIARNLHDAIVRGDYPIGAYLPTEHELTARFDVSRFTIRSALAELVDVGMIARRAGIGTVVTADSPRRPYQEGYASVEDMLRSGFGAVLRVTRITDVIVDPQVADRLRCNPGRAFLYMEGLRPNPLRADEPPLGWAEVYVDSVYGGIRDSLHDLDGPVATLIEDRYGQHAAFVDQEITVTRIPRELAERLQATIREPALEIRRWYWDSDQRAFEISRNIFPMGRFVYGSRLARQTGALPKRPIPAAIAE